MQVRMIGATDVGRRRKSNQDSLYYDELSNFGIVADGIGGRKGGEIASSLAVNGLRKAFMNSDRIRHEEVGPFLVSAVDKMNSEILERGRKEQEILGMGTTLNCLMFVGEKLHIAHVGDSRTYLYYKKHLFQLTLDHSVGNFLERGWLPKSAVQPGAKEGALVRALGLGERIDVDIYEIALKPGQLFLTCSDGLTGMVEDRRIAQIITENLDQFESLPKLLIDAANAAGGRDNITVLLSHVRG
ncbi:MAG: protein phosphatase 2C domain-containing protein [Proteobacteria bacterium]|nr:protein phosphatase 2C domain-containing protein [Pseudomonadota bacterium]